MRAYIYDYSASDQMRFVSNFPLPAPLGKREVKIKVASVGLNPIDFKIPQLPLVSWVKKATPVGVELAGQVVEVGSAVSSVKVGDQVFGGCSKGSLSEYAVSNESEISILPASLDPRLAGGYAAVSLTAMQSLRAGGVALTGVRQAQPPRVLILGASGGVGHVAVQIAKHVAGAYVCGVCSTKNVAFVQSQGADEVLDYTKTTLADFCADRNSRKFDLVLDYVSNPNFSYEAAARQCLAAPTGAYVAANTPYFSDWPRAVLAQVTGWPRLWQRKDFHLIMCKFDKSDVQLLADWLATAKIKIHTSQTVPFSAEGLQQGFAQLRSERTVGKVVVAMSGESEWSLFCWLMQRT